MQGLKSNGISSKANYFTTAMYNNVVIRLIALCACEWWSSTKNNGKSSRYLKRKMFRQIF